MLLRNEKAGCRPERRERAALRERFLQAGDSVDERTASATLPFLKKGLLAKGLVVREIFLQRRSDRVVVDRWGRVAAVLSGVLNARQGIAEQLDPRVANEVLDSPYNYLLEGSFGASLVALLVVLVAIFRPHAGQGTRSHGRSGRAGFYSALAGTVLQPRENVAHRSGRARAPGHRHAAGRRAATLVSAWSSYSSGWCRRHRGRTECTPSCPGLQLGTAAWLTSGYTGPYNPKPVSPAGSRRQMSPAVSRGPGL
jgi:hypothetical protein